jgi:hypothetical protein
MMSPSGFPSLLKHVPWYLLTLASHSSQQTLLQNLLDCVYTFHKPTAKHSTRFLVACSGGAVPWAGKQNMMLPSCVFASYQLARDTGKTKSTALHPSILAFG